MLLELIKSGGFWGLVGVTLGVLLGEGSRYIRHRARIRKLKRIILEELKSIQAQIPQKIDIIKKIISALKKREMLGGISVRAFTVAYNQHIGELYEHLTLLERNCLHVIYEKLRNADDVLFSLEEDFVTAVRDGIIKDPYAAFRDRLQDFLENYRVTNKLIESYLDGNPIDVFHIPTPS